MKIQWEIEVFEHPEVPKTGKLGPQIMSILRSEKQVN